MACISHICPCSIAAKMLSDVGASCNTVLQSQEMAAAVRTRQLWIVVQPQLAQPWERALVAPGCWDGRLQRRIAQADKGDLPPSLAPAVRQLMGQDCTIQRQVPQKCAESIPCAIWRACTAQHALCCMLQLVLQMHMLEAHRPSLLEASAHQWSLS